VGAGIGVYFVVSTLVDAELIDKRGLGEDQKRGPTEPSIKQQITKIHSYRGCSSHWATRQVTLPSLANLRALNPWSKI
jgi:hypothetical protein